MTTPKNIIVKISARKERIVSVRYPGGHEVVSAVAEIEHPVVRRALQNYGLSTGLDIFINSELASTPEEFSLGLVSALNLFRGAGKSEQKLAEEARGLLA